MDLQDTINKEINNFFKRLICINSMVSHAQANNFAISKPENQQDPKCHPHCFIETEEIETLKGKILNTNKAQRMAEFFSLLGDSNRLRILSMLAHQEFCVCDIANILDMSESAVSHQLRTLRAMRLVKYDKRGRKVFYRLLDRHVLELYQSVAEHLDEKD